PHDTAWAGHWKAGRADGDAPAKCQPPWASIGVAGEFNRLQFPLTPLATFLEPCNLSALHNLSLWRFALSSLTDPLQPFAICCNLSSPIKYLKFSALRFLHASRRTKFSNVGSNWRIIAAQLGPMMTTSVLVHIRRHARVSWRCHLPPCLAWTTKSMMSPIFFISVALLSGT